MFEKFAANENRTEGRTGIKPRPLFLLVFLLLFSGLSGFAHAQETSAETQTDDAVIAEVERLRALKQQNPQAYQEHIQKKREQLKNHLETLKQDQSGYQVFMEKEGKFKQARLQRLQTRKPEAFQKFMTGRAERLEKLSQKNPERFNQVMNRHPRAQAWHEKRRMNENDGNRQRRGPDESRLASDAGGAPSLNENQPFRNHEKPAQNNGQFQAARENAQQGGAFVRRHENSGRLPEGQNRGEFKERQFKNREAFQAGQNPNQGAAFNSGARQFQEGRAPMRNEALQNQNQMNRNGGDRPKFQGMNASNGNGKPAAQGEFGQKHERGGRNPRK